MHSTPQCLSESVGESPFLFMRKCGEEMFTPRLKVDRRKENKGTGKKTRINAETTIKLVTTTTTKTTTITKL